jgi:hypothetical protein
VSGYPYRTDALAALHDEDRWQDVPTVSVATADLIPTQSHVVIDRLTHLLDGGEPETGDPYPHVIAHKGRLYVHDGHHRYVLALASKQAEMKVRLVNENGETV